MARKVPEINAGSMADIAFLLLIFFLVTTTMDVDSGITRRLPPPLEPNPDEEPIKDRNIFVVLVNSADQLLVEGKEISINQLRMEAKIFLSNPTNSESLPEMIPISEKIKIAIAKNKPKQAKKYTDVKKMLGDIRISKGVISLQNDRGTSYDMYIQVQNELAAAVRELRDEMAKDKFSSKFSKLNKDQAKAIQKAIPVSISEAEPKDIGG